MFSIQLYILLLVMGLMVGSTSPLGGLTIGPAWRAGWLVGPYLLAGGLTWLVCRRGLRRLDRLPHRGSLILRRTALAMDLIYGAALLCYFAGLFLLNLLDWLTDLMAGWQLPAQLVMLAGPLAVPVVGWWAYYPIDRRLRESALIRCVDEGRPLWPIWSRPQYLLSQVRHQMLILLGPLVLLLAWWQMVHLVIDRGRLDPVAEPALLAVGALLIFLAAPLLIRLLWDTRPLPDGPLRRQLLQLARHCGVRVGQLLLWQTYGGMVNAAVIGLLPPLRYILLTDGLLEQMPQPHVQAVMAHELGHVKKRHLPGLLLCALGCFAGLYLLVERLALGLDRLLVSLGASAGPLLADSLGRLTGPATVLTTTGTVLLWAVAFGFISRRFERQADTFAIQHLSAPHPHITEQAVQAMTGALQAVASLNHLSVERKNWRHGSIQWRCQYLQSLVGRPIDQCPIDRLIRRLCWANAAVLAAVLAWETLTEGPLFG